MNFSKRYLVAALIIATLGIGVSLSGIGGELLKVQTTSTPSAGDSTCGYMIEIVSSSAVLNVKAGETIQLTANFKSLCTRNEDTITIEAIGELICSLNPATLTLKPGEQKSTVVSCPTSEGNVGPDGQSGNPYMLVRSRSQQLQLAGFSHPFNSVGFSPFVAPSAYLTADTCGAGYTTRCIGKNNNYYCVAGNTCPAYIANYSACNTSGWISCPNAQSVTGNNCYQGTSCLAVTTTNTNITTSQTATTTTTPTTIVTPSTTVTYPTTSTATGCAATQVACPAPNNTFTCFPAGSTCLGNNTSGQYSRNCAPGWNWCYPSTGEPYCAVDCTSATTQKIPLSSCNAGNIYCPAANGGYVCKPLGESCPAISSIYSTLGCEAAGTKTCYTPGGAPYCASSCPVMDTTTTPSSCAAGLTMCYPPYGGPYCAVSCNYTNTSQPGGYTVPVSGGICPAGQVYCPTPNGYICQPSGTACSATNVSGASGGCSTGQILCMNGPAGSYCATSCSPTPSPSTYPSSQPPTYIPSATTSTNQYGTPVSPPPPASTPYPTTHYGTPMPPPAPMPYPAVSIQPPLSSQSTQPGSGNVMVCPTGQILCKSSGGGSYCASYCSVPNNDMPPAPKECKQGEICSSNSWCSFGQSCYYSDARMTCAPWNSDTGEPTACPADTSNCSPFDSGCVPLDKIVEFSNNKWCNRGMPYYSKDGKQMTCISGEKEPPADFTSCRPGEVGCIPAGGTGPLSGYCSNGMSCYQVKTDSDTNNDKLCVKYPYYKPPFMSPATTASMIKPESPKCPLDYSSCNPTDKNCRQQGDNWTADRSEIYCTDSRKCTNKSGGASCVNYDIDCPDDTVYCDENSKKYGCLESKEERTFSGGMMSMPYCGNSGLVVYSGTAKSYKAYCVPRPQNSWNDSNWVPKLPEGDWLFCRPGDNLYCLEPGQSGPSSSYCAWMPGGYMMNPYTYSSNKKTCPALGEKIEKKEPLITDPDIPDPTKPILPPIQPVCIDVLTPAKNLETSECRFFPSPCMVPKGWIQTACEPKAKEPDGKKPILVGPPVDKECEEAKDFISTRKRLIEASSDKLTLLDNELQYDQITKLNNLQRQLISLLNKYALQVANGQCRDDKLKDSINALNAQISTIHEDNLKSDTKEYLQKELVSAGETLEKIKVQVLEQEEDIQELLEDIVDRTEFYYEEVNNLYNEEEYAAASDKLEQVYRNFDRIARYLKVSEPIYDESTVERRLTELVGKVFDEKIKPQMEQLVNKFSIKANEMVVLMENKLDGLLKAVADVNDQVASKVVQVAKNLNEIDEKIRIEIAGVQEKSLLYVQKLEELENQLKEANLEKDYLKYLDRLQALGEKAATIVLMPESNKTVTACIDRAKVLIEDQASTVDIDTNVSDCEKAWETILLTEYDKQFNTKWIPFRDARIDRWDLGPWIWAQKNGVFKGTERSDSSGKLIATGEVDAGRFANVAEAEMTICRLYKYAPLKEIPISIVNDVPGLSEVPWAKDCNYWLQSKGSKLAAELDVRRDIEREEIAELLIDGSSGLITLPTKVDVVSNYPDVAKLPEKLQLIIEAVVQPEIMTGIGLDHPNYGKGNWGAGLYVDRAALCAVLQRTVEAFGLAAPSES